MIKKKTKFIFSLLEEIVPKYCYFHIRYRIDKIFKAKGMDSLKLLHYYWSHNPTGNQPEDYVTNDRNKKTSKVLVKTISKYVNPENTILELGTNVGRNLHFLSESGFKKLFGVEINKRAVDLMKSEFPGLWGHVKIYNEPIESFLQKNNMRCDLIFTSAVLEHIHYDSEWVFNKIPLFTNRYLLTLEIEDLKVDFHRIVGRKYKEIFENLNLTCIEERRFPDTHTLGNYTLRVFEKNGIANHQTV